MLRRVWLSYLAIGHAFGTWVSPLVTAVLFTTLRLVVALGMALDLVFFPAVARTRIERPIVMVGLPRCGTTFLQRFLHRYGVGAGLELWRMVYPSLTLQALIRPLLPILEKVSPTRHHPPEVHEAGLTMVETDDAGMFLRYFDGFFLYAFVLAWSKQELRSLVDPRERDTSARDAAWLSALWRRNLVATGRTRVLAKLFSVSAWLPAFLRHYPDARILHLVRDPVDVIPSALSMVVSVLDKRIGFWRLSAAKRQQFVERLYSGLVLMSERFHEDWTTGRIPHEQVLVVRYSQLMGDFDGVMTRILEFTGMPKSPELADAIAAQAAKQRGYRSKHAYDLERFGLDAERIRRDCAFVYDTFGV